MKINKSNKELRETRCEKCNKKIWYNYKYVKEEPKRCERCSAQSGNIDYNLEIALDIFDAKCSKSRLTPMMSSVRKKLIKSWRKENKKRRRELNLQDRYDLGEWGSNLNALGVLRCKIPKRPK